MLPKNWPKWKALSQPNLEMSCQWRFWTKRVTHFSSIQTDGSDHSFRVSAMKATSSTQISWGVKGFLMKPVATDNLAIMGSKKCCVSQNAPLMLMLS
jgi:hypothetical protein